MKLPDNTSLQRVIPDGTSAPVRGANISLGGDTAELGAGLQQVTDRRAAFDSAKAKAAFLKAKTIQDNAFDQDRDYETIPERYEQTVREAMEESAKGIRSSRARAMFLEENDVLIQSGIERMQAKAFEVEKDEARSSVNEQLNDLNAVGLQGDPFAAIETMQSLLSGGVEAGYYSAEDAGKVDRAWRDTFAANKVASMPADKRIEALSQPWAANLPPSVRMRLTDEAEADARRDRAVEIVDGYMAQGMDLGVMRREIRQIEDRKLREEVEARRDYEFRQREDAKVEDQDQVFEKYGMAVRTGEMRVSDIPRDALDFLDQAQIDALERIEVNKRKSVEIDTDRGVYAGFYELLSKEDFTGARKYLYNNADRVGDDFDTLLSKAAKPNPDEDPNAVNSARTLTQATAQALRNVGMSKPSEEDKGEILIAYDRRYKDYQRANDGLEPDDAWRDQTLEELATRLRIDRPGWFNDRTRSRYEYEKIGTIPPQYSQAVVAAFGDETRMEQADAEAYFGAAMAYLSEQGFNEPSDLAVTDMIKYLREQAKEEAGK